MSEQLSTFPVRGMRDFLPAELVRRQRVLQVIRSTVSDAGFFEIETPSVEDIKKLKSKQGGENESMIFEIMKRGLDETDIKQLDSLVDSGLRYDLTVPLSRYYAHNHGQLPQVFRAFQTGSVWRAERPQKGRFREFRQCDVDILGSDSVGSEIEVLSLGCQVLQRLGLLNRAVFHINDRRLLDWMLAYAEVDEELRPAVMIELDKLDKKTPEEVQISVAALLADEAKAIRIMTVLTALLRLTELEADAQELQVPELGVAVPLFDIPRIMAEVRALHASARLVFDAALVRGMGYYTGTIYEVKLEGSSSSICGGGRYDHMIGKWLGKDVPAVGFSFGFERFVQEVSDDVLEQSDKLALAYRSDEEYLMALRHQRIVRDCYPSSGLVRLPKKLKQAFFDDLAAQGFTSYLSPQYELSRAEALMEQVKPL